MPTSKGKPVNAREKCRFHRTHGPPALISPMHRNNIWPIMTRHIRSNIWLRIAVAYFAIAVGLGIAMGATKNFTLMPVPGTLDYLGWLSTSLIGLSEAR